MEQNVLITLIYKHNDNMESPEVILLLYISTLWRKILYLATIYGRTITGGLSHLSHKQSNEIIVGMVFKTSP